MTSLPLDFSATEKPAQVQENMIAYLPLFAHLPGMVMDEDAETFWFVSNKPAPGNFVFRACWSAERIKKRIDVIFTQIATHTDQIDWMIFPGDSPSDLSRRLEAGSHDFTDLGRHSPPADPGWAGSHAASIGA